MTEIQRLFVRKGLKVGDRLPPERELAKLLSVGRSSLREAVQGLQAMGFLEVRHGVGTFFASEPGKWVLTPLRYGDTPPRQLFAELIEARLLVEVRLAALAAERANDEDIGRMRDAARQREQARKGEYLDRGLSFHFAVAAGAHHAVLESMLKAVLNLYFDTLDSLDRAARDVEAALRTGQHRGHETVLHMIEARDPQGAADAMQEHLRDLQAALFAVTEPSPTALSVETVP